MSYGYEVASVPEGEERGARTSNPLQASAHLPRLRGGHLTEAGQAVLEAEQSVAEAPAPHLMPNLADLYGARFAALQDTLAGKDAWWQAHWSGRQGHGHDELWAMQVWRRIEGGEEALIEVDGAKLRSRAGARRRSGRRGAGAS